MNSYWPQEKQNMFKWNIFEGIPVSNMLNLPDSNKKLFLMEPILDSKFKAPYVKTIKFEIFWKITALGPSLHKLP